MTLPAFAPFAEQQKKIDCLGGGTGGEEWGKEADVSVTRNVLSREADFGRL